MFCYIYNYNSNLTANTYVQKYTLLRVDRLLLFYKSLNQSI